MKILSLLVLASSAVFGSLVTQVTCTVVTPTSNVTYNDASSCPGASVTTGAQPYDLSVSMNAGAGILGHAGEAGYSTDIFISINFQDSFEILDVAGGSIQWFGDLTHFNPGNAIISGSVGIGGHGWPAPVPITTPFASGQSIPILIDMTFWGQCCNPGADALLYAFLLDQIKVFDANGNLVANPHYASASGYAYPVLGGVESVHMPEPGTWVLAAVGLVALVAVKSRFRHTPDISRR